MARIVRTETRQRGPIGQVFKWLFIIFNVLMLVWMVSYCSSASDMMNSATSDAERAGGAIGATIASGLLLTIWVAGVIILGAFTMFTRGKKVIVEEERD